MALSDSTNFVETRDSIITRALRITGGIGQGDSPTTTQITESAQALNAIVKKFGTAGMHLWERFHFSFTPVAGTSSYAIGKGATIDFTAPLKVIQAFSRNTATNTDSPMILITNYEYQMLGNKSSQGTPTMLLYTPPFPGSTTGTLIGAVALYPTPDAAYVASSTIHFHGQLPIQDFDTSSDNPDFPSYWYNALVWALAAELAWEYGTGVTELSMIQKKAQEEFVIASSFDLEEGSAYFQPDKLRVF